LCNSTVESHPGGERWKSRRSETGGKEEREIVEKGKKEIFFNSRGRKGEIENRAKKIDKKAGKSNRKVAGKKR
jgi:hypothetical protein